MTSDPWHGVQLAIDLGRASNARLAKSYAVPCVIPADLTEYEFQLLGFLTQTYAWLDRNSLGNAIVSGYLTDCLAWAVKYREWRQQNCDWPAEWHDLTASDPDEKIDMPAAADLQAEYDHALEHTPPAALRLLANVGVTSRGLELARPAVASVQQAGAGGFQFNPDSAVQAIIVPVRVDYPETPESTDLAATLQHGKIVDLVAFTPGLGAGWALYGGCAEWLGACPPQYFDPDPVKLYRSPLDWLRASCDGLVCLATAPTDIYRFLTRFQALDIDDPKFADELQEILSRPPHHPRILGRADYAA